MATGTPNFKEAVERAIARADTLGEDLVGLAERVRTSLPEELNNPKQMRARQRFLESIYDESKEAEQAFERIIGGNELQDANFLARGALVARTVLRIVIRSSSGRVLGYGTGSLIGDGVLITNNHVLPSSDTARASDAEAFYERGLDGQDAQTLRFALQPDKAFYTSKPLDFSIVGIADADSSGSTSTKTLGWLPLIGTTGKVVEGEWMTIVQHPKGERKQLCVRDNQLLKCDTDVLWYSTDTLGGSSGSPVFNNDWLVVALHHSGVPEVKDGQWQTVDGRDYDPQRDDESKIKWIANEGIRISRILETLRTDNAIANNSLVDPVLKTVVEDVQVRLPVLYSTDAHRSAAVAALVPAPASSSSSPASAQSGGGAPKPTRESSMSKRRITVTLEIDENGRVTLEGGGAVESSLLEAELAPKKKKQIVHAPVVPERDWIGGYDPAFLVDAEDGDPRHVVHLPEVVQTEKIARLRDAYGQTFTDEERAAGVLKYKGYSVVMNKDRRFAFYSAANVDGAMRPTVSGRVDRWMFDDRILREHQVDDSYYKNNQFDRGHLTRRDDMEWGSDLFDAVNRANGTCTWTNCAAQHGVFNQGKEKGVLLWQNLERYILEEAAAAEKFRAQVITGPIFAGNDPVHRNLAYPLEYWKVVAAVTRSGKLFATGYILGQKETIDKHGLETTADEPFGAFGTYQRSIAVIENVTGLKFTYGPDRRPLSEVDPLGQPTWRPRRSRGGAASATESTGGGADDDSLGGFGDILLGDV